MKKRGWFTRSQLWFLLIVLNACLVLLAALFLSRYRNGRGGGMVETMREVSADRSAPASSRYYAVDASQPESFPFDPNEADSTAKIARCKEMLAYLLNKVDTLIF